MRRVLKDKGTTSFSSWEMTSWLDNVADAAKLIPGCPAWPEGDEILLRISSGNPWHTEDFVRSKLSSNGFPHITYKQNFNNFSMTPEEFASSFCGPMSKPICAKLWGAEAAELCHPQLAAALEADCAAKGVEAIAIATRAGIYTGRK